MEGLRRVSSNARNNSFKGRNYDVIFVLEGFSILQLDGHKIQLRRIPLRQCL